MFIRIGSQKSIDIFGFLSYIRHLNICSFVTIMNNYTKKTPMIDELTAAHVAELFRAFSDTSRVRILFALTTQEINVNALAELVGISESAVSHHLRSLRQMGLVVARREGKEVFYRIEDEHIISLFSEGVKHIQYG
jgi:DNA-binding transcriptional ArsR family regulator